MKRLIALVMAITILLSSCCIAMPLPKKRETVYINLDSYGAVKQINLYSKWVTNSALKLEDHTKYKSISNLTNRTEYEKSGETIIWNLSGEKTFASTGEVTEDYYNLIPWTFDISYRLNGVDTSPKELLGAKGLIKISIDINANKNANDFFKNNYMLEITGSYDMSKYLSVESEDAMITDVGNTRTLMFIVLPGQSTEIDIEIGSDNFSMDGITMALIPLTGDIRDQIIELVDDKKEIEDAIESINNSTDIVLNSMSGMTSGLNGVSKGLKEIKQGTYSLHGMNDLRDEDIKELKTILEELLPILQNVQNDIDNIQKNYDIVIELDEKLSSQMKELSSNINQLNTDVDELNKVLEKTPNNIVQINDIVKSTQKVVSSSSALLKRLSSSSNESTESLTEDLTNIGNETANIGKVVQQTIPTVSDEATVGALMNIGKSASNIGDDLKSVQKTLNEMSSSSLSGTKTLINNLNDLSDNLHDASDIISKKDAQKFVKVTKSLSENMKTIEKSLNTINKYNDDLINNKEDFIVASNNIKELTNELIKMDSLGNSMLTNTQSMLDIVSNDIYSGTNNTSDALISVNNQMMNITSQSNNIRKSKDSVKKIVDDRIDEIENKTTIFNLDKSDETVSFGSEENEYVEAVQFVIKTPDIKKIKVNNIDLEKEKDNKTFFEKVVLIFEKIIDWIKSIFG